MVNEDTGEQRLAELGWAAGKLILKHEVSDCIWTVGGIKVKSCKETLSLPSLESRLDAKIQLGN